MRSSADSNALARNAGNRWSNALFIRPVFYFEGLQLGIVDLLNRRLGCEVLPSDIEFKRASISNPASTCLLSTLAGGGFANRVEDFALSENGCKNCCLVHGTPPLGAQLADSLTMLPQTDGRKSQVAVRYWPVMTLLIFPKYAREVTRIVLDQ